LYFVHVLFFDGVAMHLVHNERTKLTATWLNTLATALIAAGGFAPAAAYIYGLAALPIGGGFIVALMLGCFVFGMCLHFVGWSLLGSLRE
jgi:hypothetical protein